MIHLIVLLNVNDAENVDKVRELLTQCCRLSRAEPGCARFEVYHYNNDNKALLITAHLDSQAALDTLLQPLVSRVPHLSTLLEP